MARRIAILLLPFALSCNSSVGAVPEPTHEMSLAHERLTAGARALDALLAEGPDHPVSALASFTAPQDIGDAVIEAHRCGLIVTGFRHGSPTHSGGYTLAPGESIEDAIDAYRRDAELFPRRRAARIRELAMNAGDERGKALFTQHVVDLEQQAAAVNASGLKVTGIEASGSARELDEFRRSVHFVRGIEPRGGTRRDAAIPPFVP